MAARSTSNDKVLLDLIFKVPEGAEEEFTFSTDFTEVEPEFELDEEIQEEVENYVEDDSDSSIENDIEVPSEFFVFSQQLRRAPGGQQVVDVVLEVEDILGGIKYEVNITKV